MKKVLGIILARAGSKRLPGKNSLMFNGKPLIEWSIIQAIESKRVDTLVVSTDCPTIKELCKKYKEVIQIDMPPHLTGSFAKSEQNIQYVLENNEPHEIILLLQCTSPLRKASDIGYALDLMQDCIVSVNVQNSKWNGAIYACKTEKFISEATFNPDTYYYMSPYRSIDIDTIEDFEAAEKEAKYGMGVN